MLRPVGSGFNCSSFTCLTMCGTSTGSALPPSLSLFPVCLSLLFEQFNFQFDFIVCLSLYGYKSPAALTFRSAFCTWLTSQCHLSPFQPPYSLSTPFGCPSCTLPYTCFTVGHFIFSFQRATALKSIKNLFKSPSPEQSQPRMRALFIYQFIVSVGSRHVRSAVCCFQAHVLYKLNIKWLPRSHTPTHTHQNTHIRTYSHHCWSLMKKAYKNKKTKKNGGKAVGVRGSVGVGCASFIKTFNTHGLLIDFVCFGQTFIFGSYRQA